MHSDSCYTVFATTLRVSLNLLHRKKKEYIKGVKKISSFVILVLFDPIQYIKVR
jgi:stage III sporulation protein SpoIIIAA